MLTLEIGEEKQQVHQNKITAILIDTSAFMNAGMDFLGI